MDGRVLFDLGPTRRDALPPRGSPHDAISPACNDGGPPFEADGDTTVVTLAGIPPDIAVVDELGTTYVADGSLVATGAHPLHLAVHGARDRPSARTGRTCRPGPTVRGRAVSAGPDGITFDDDRVVRVDAATRIANRPAYEPVAAGQPLAVAASRCGRQLVADSVRFEGATVRPARYERFTAGAGGTHGWWIALMLALAVGLVAGMGRIVLGPRP